MARKNKMHGLRPRIPVWARGVLLAAICQTPLHAESPWSGLARWISPDAQTESPAAELPETEQESRGISSVDNEELGVSHGTKNKPYDPQMASLDAQNMVNDLGRSITGLATNNGNNTLELGLESEENMSLLAINLFEDPAIRQLLGDNPRFIYDPQEKQDPMLVPWVRRAAIYRELSVRAERFMEEDNLERAIELYRRVVALDDDRYTPIARAKLQEIAQMQRADALSAQMAMQQNSEEAETIELPMWVYDNTTGVIFEPGQELCLVGEYMLHVGDTLPNYPQIEVKQIERESVTFQFRSREFQVALNK